MKRKIIAWLMAVSVCVAAVPEIPAKADTGLHIGHFESYEQFRSSAENGVLTVISGDAPASAAALPESFDLREKGLVTPVRNQGSYGMCWAFSALASLESSLVARNPLVDLSEWHLAYYTYSDVFGFQPDNSSGAADILRQGGNVYMLSPILTRWIGPVAEDVFTFGDFSVLNPNATPEDLVPEDVYHVTDVNILPYEQGTDDFEAQINAIRQAVFNGHAVAVSYQNRGNCYSTGNETYYSDLEDDGISGHHAVTIVGWDDHFPAERFVKNPGRNGAWLMKNSWGTNWGNNGYFWMSYADASISDPHYLEAEPIQVHDDQYRHDDYGYWTAFSVDENDTSAFSANVFTAEEDTWLTSAMFCTAMPEDDYTIRVYTDLKNSRIPDSGNLASVTEGHAPASGYHTADLSEPVFLKAGQQFSIVVRFSGSEGQHISCESFIRYTTEYPDGSKEIQESMTTESAIANSLHAGESFYSADGMEWYDIYEEDVISESYPVPSDDGEVQMGVYARLGNLTIRGLTQKPGKVVFSEYEEALPYNTSLTLRCPGADAIYYSINGEEETIYTEPILLTEEMTLSAHAVSGGTEYPVYTQHYRIQAAQLSSLLNTGSGEYLEFEALADNEFITTIRSTASLSLLPITTGEIICDTAELVSGKITETDFPVPALTFRVRNEGMQESLYAIYISGDVNLDGSINASDAADVLEYAALVGSGSLTEETSQDAAWIARADYDGNGTVDAADAAEILIEAAAHGAGE